MKVSGLPNAPQITTLENLLPTALYEVQVSAANEIGNSSFSDITYAWTTSPGKSMLLQLCVLHSAN